MINFKQYLKESTAPVIFKHYTNSTGLWTMNRSPVTCVRCATKTCLMNCYTGLDFRTDDTLKFDKRVESYWKNVTAEQFKIDIEKKANNARIKEKKLLERFRFCERGEPIVTSKDIKKIEKIAGSMKETLFWIPTRSWNTGRTKSQEFNDVADQIIADPNIHKSTKNRLNIMKSELETDLETNKTDDISGTSGMKETHCPLCNNTLTIENRNVLTEGLGGLTSLMKKSNIRLLASIDNDPVSQQNWPSLVKDGWSTIYFSADEPKSAPNGAKIYPCPKALHKAPPGHCKNCNKGCFHPRPIHIWMKDHGPQTRKNES